MNAPQGFAQIPTWMIRDTSIKRSSLLVFASLSSRSGLGAIYPSQGTIAEESGVSVRTVRSALAELEALGVVDRHSRRSSEGKSTSLTTAYTLHPNGRYEAPAESAGSYKGPAEGTGNQAHAVPLIEVENRGSEKPATRAKAHALPAGWAPNESHAARARERGVDVALEAESFRLHAEANDRRAVRWDAAFSQWLLKARPMAGAAVGAQSSGDEWLDALR